MVSVIKPPVAILAVTSKVTEVPWAIGERRWLLVFSKRSVFCQPCSSTSALDARTNRFHCVQKREVDELFSGDAICSLGKSLIASQRVLRALSCHVPHRVH